MTRGSRKHVLDWTGQPSFLDELRQLLAPIPLAIPPLAVMMPRGHREPEEARLETFGPAWLPDNSAWIALKDWWLVHHAGANTPNWDIAVGANIEGRHGLILVEAKANWPELGSAGKILRQGASSKSRENHERIGAAIREACAGWRAVDDRVSIDAGSHYQLANRLAFIWKLATLGVPSVLVYLGFTGDDGIRDVGDPFADDADWQRAFVQYTEGIFPQELLAERIEFAGTPAWVVCASRPVIEPSQPTA